MEILSGRPEQGNGALERSLALGGDFGAQRSVGWQYTLLAGLRQRSGDPTAASALTPTANGFEANRAWARGTRDAMAPFGTGWTYVNFTGDADPEQVQRSYPPQTHARLAAVKARYDPGNLFRFNHNIQSARAR